LFLPCQLLDQLISCDFCEDWKLTFLELEGLYRFPLSSI